MPQIAENLASRYATAVIDVLAEYFPAIDDSFTKEQVAWHAQNPSEPFETCIDLTREWRLHREDGFRERWRVLLHCHKDNWTEDDIRFSDSINRRLRAIRLEA